VGVDDDPDPELQPARASAQRAVSRAAVRVRFTAPACRA